MEFLYGLVMAGLVAALVSTPFRRPRTAVEAEDPRVAELEAARDAKFREIRDAETDFGTGKLERDDFERLDATLRAEAVELTGELDRARERSRSTESDND